MRFPGTLPFLAFGLMLAGSDFQPAHASRQTASIGPFPDRRLPSIESKKKLEDKCDLLLLWLRRLDEEHPNPSLTLFGRPQRLFLVYRDEDFVPLFGQPFDRTTPKWRLEFHKKVIQPCEGLVAPRAGSRPLQEYGIRFSPYRAVLDGPFADLQTPLFSASAASKVVEAGRQARGRLNATIGQITATPASPESFSYLNGQAVRPPDPPEGLWPSEQRHLQRMFEIRRAEVAREIVENWALSLGRQNASLETAQRIVLERQDQAKYLRYLDPGKVADVDRQMAAALDEMVLPALANRVAGLPRIPATLAGVSQAAEWRAEFDRDFRSFPTLPTVAAAQKLFDSSRDRILAGAVPEWQALLDRGSASEQALRSRWTELAALLPASPQRDELQARYERVLASAATRRADDERAAASAVATGAANGDVAAMLELAWNLLEGRSTRRDPAAAAGWYRRAADAGSAVAMNNLAWMYEHGIGVARDRARATEWYTRAIDKGHVSAMQNMAQLLVRGVGIEADAAAQRWYAEQAKVQERWECPTCAPISTPRPESVMRLDRAASQLHQKAAVAGDARAMASYAAMHLSGRAADDGRSRLDQFVHWSRQSAEAGDSMGMLQLGLAYLRGIGIERNENEGLRWLRQSAELGDLEAIHRLGWMYTTGSPTLPKNEVEATRWWRQGAAAGDGRAMTRLAYDYFNGRGGLAPNQAEGVRWALRAVEMEEPEATAWLAGWYTDGDRGFEKDPSKARALWIRLAASRDPNKAALGEEHLRMIDADRYNTMQARRNRDPKTYAQIDALVNFTMVAALFGAVAEAAGGGSNGILDSPSRYGIDPLVFGGGQQRTPSCEFVSRAYGTLHGSRSIMGGPGTMLNCR